MMHSANQPWEMDCQSAHVGHHVKQALDKAWHFSEKGIKGAAVPSVIAGVGWAVEDEARQAAGAGARLDIAREAACRPR
jgi:hypothetical protein